MVGARDADPRARRRRPRLWAPERRLLYEEDPVFADFDEERYRRASLARGETAEALLDTITGEHEQTARLLAALPAADWARQGRHPVFGVVSIEFLARRIGEHTVEHAAQIATATAADLGRVGTGSPLPPVLTTYEVSVPVIDGDAYGCPILSARDT